MLDISLTIDVNLFIYLSTKEQYTKHKCKKLYEWVDEIKRDVTNA